MTDVQKVAMDLYEFLADEKYGNHDGYSHVQEIEASKLLEKLEVFATHFKIGIEQVQEIVGNQEDESVVPCDTRLGQEVALYIKKYFPESTVTSIKSKYHSGVFIGDFSVYLDVTLEHPCIERVVLTFIHEDVPGRPKTWEGLLALPGIRLFMKSLTIRDVTYAEDKQNRSVTYSSPGMFQEKLENWCNAQDDGMLYQQISTGDVFLIATEGVDLDAIKKSMLDMLAQDPF